MDPDEGYDPYDDIEGTPEVPLSVSITFKGGSGFDAPWIVLRGGDVDTVKREVWRLSESSREALENGDILLGVAQAGAEFSGKAALSGLAPRPQGGTQQYAKNDGGQKAGYTNGAGEPASGKNIQQAGPYVPQWAVGLEIPIGNVTGLPMKPKEGNGPKGYWASWMDPRNWNDIKHLPREDRDTPVNAPKN